MEKTLLKIVEKEYLTDNVVKMVLEGEHKPHNAGQFVNLKLDGFFLRRPISVCDDGEKLTLIFKIVGGGTSYLSEQKEGRELDVLCGLGNGFDLSLSGDSPLLIGGGVGTPPMYYLAKKLLEEGKKPSVILGFNRKEEVFFEREFKDLGVQTTITTVDGSYGVKGFVTDALKDASYSYFYACGPIPMLKALYRATTEDGEMSFEERMGCGFGACMGCSMEVKGGYKRVCKDGPVFKKGELLWI